MIRIFSILKIATIINSTRFDLTHVDIMTSFHRVFERCTIVRKVGWVPSLSIICGHFDSCNDTSAKVLYFPLNDSVLVFKHRSYF